jgi:hypothetical protein
LANVLESSGGEHVRQSAAHVLRRGLEAVEELHQQERGTHHAIPGLPPISDMQLSSRPQDARHLARGAFLVLMGQVMEQ